MKYMKNYIIKMLKKIFSHNKEKNIANFYCTKKYLQYLLSKIDIFYKPFFEY